MAIYSSNADLLRVPLAGWQAHKLAKAKQVPHVAATPWNSEEEQKKQPPASKTQLSVYSFPPPWDPCWGLEHLGSAHLSAAISSSVEKLGPTQEQGKQNQ